MNGYINNAGNSYMCMFYASKAFDCANILFICTTKAEEQVPNSFEILSVHLSKAFVMVKWNAEYSPTFSISNGINKDGYYHRFFLLFV